jgi:hypothetical protein
MPNPYQHYSHLQKTLEALNEAWFLGVVAAQEYITRIEAAFDSRLDADQPKIDKALSLGFYALRHTEPQREQRLALRAVLLANYLTNPQQDPGTLSGGLRGKYESYSTDALKQEFVSLMSAGTQLVDTFTAIRGYNIDRNAADPRATLAPADVRTLLTLSSSISAPLVVVTPNIGPGAGVAAALNGYKVDITFQTTFRSNVQAARPNRVIRFVRAAEVNNSFFGTEQKYTMPGYVYYANHGLPSSGAASRTRTYFRTKLATCYSHAGWSFDGPHQEFVNGLSNEDNPGTNYTVKPYAITAEFLTVLYNETAKLVYEVGHFAASYAAWDDGGTSFTRLAGVV